MNTRHHIMLFTAGMLVASAGNVLAAKHYVDQRSTNATPPYTNWATAATRIQDAVVVAGAGDEIVVTNGNYASFAANTPLSVRSTSGAQFTVIDGGHSGRCASLINNASLSGFTLTNGASEYGAGAYGGTLNNCVLRGNSAGAGDYLTRALYGGGAYGCILNNCTLSGNSAGGYYGTNYLPGYGGGAYSCTLSNCTLSGNSAPYGGGASGCTVINCTLTGNSVSLNWAAVTFGGGGGASGCTLNNCTLSYNGAEVFYGGGGGASECTLNNCTLSGNWANVTSGGGGGASGCTLNNCTLSGNSIWSLQEGGSLLGGGVSGCTMTNCALNGNSATYGGGAYGGTLKNCTLRGNSATWGGGSYQSTLINCALSGNSADDDGGGVYGGILKNCTLAGNSANLGGGAFACVLTNCIAYFNSGANYDPSCAFDHCCTTPLPTGGVGNISADPQLADASHLSDLSPCIGRGSYDAVSGADIDGEPWANPPSMGCDEYHAGNVTGPLSIGIGAPYTSVSVGFPANFTALIAGHADLNVWVFGDGGLEVNEPYATHSWAIPGDYVVSLWCFNDNYPGGISTNLTVHVVLGLHYVAANSTNALAPYTSWATAATNIQDVINAAAAGTVIMVTNGTYAPITANTPLSVRSINGAQFTIIDGGGLNRCASLGNSVSLSGFTLTNGASEYGAGAYGGTLNSCVLSGNSASANSDYDAYAYGGRAYHSTLNNCTLSGNSAIAIAEASGVFIPDAYAYGGGAYGCTLNNCTLSGNWATAMYARVGIEDGGGAYGSVLNNCTLTGNSVHRGGSSQDYTAGGGAYGGTLNNCIVLDGTSSSTLNYCWTTDPLFVDRAAGNLRLQSNSPCINAGKNALSPAGPDLDGNPRIVGGAVDIGAYEYQTPTSIISSAWLQQYGLPADGSADFADPDHDGMNNWQEWRAGTNPTNALSALRMLKPMITTANATVTWQSVAGVNYFLDRSTNLAALPAFEPLATNILGQAGTTSFTDTNVVGAGPFFYRVGVGN